MRKPVVLILIFVITLKVYAQVEHVPVVHPVYTFLLHAETKGLLPHYSLSSLPLQRSEVISALKLIRENSAILGSAELSTLENFEREFEILPRNNAVVFYSTTDSTEVLSSRFFSNDEKFFYRYEDSGTTVNVIPLGSAEYLKELGNGNRNVLLGNLGVRLHGTIKNVLGYFLQATNGTVFSGDRYLALEDNNLAHNVKFAKLGSDFDFTESHINFQYDWFYASIGRETRLLGAGLNQRLFISSNAPPFDALSIGAKFSNFEYRFTHGSLIGFPINNIDMSSVADIPPKYIAIHRFALKPSWGEIAFWENIIYWGKDRNVDLAYLNPLSFLKSLEHSLHDRDNSMMGGDVTLRPFDGIQLKGSYLLDDIIFSKIGTGYWSNKTAWNIAAIASLPFAIDLGVEYARVEPYTFTHFNPQISMTNDSALFGGYLLPNSDETSLLMQWWWGNRYPVIIRISYMRHGNNIYDANGNLVRNVGGNPVDPDDKGNPQGTVTFLDGDRQNVFSIQLQTGWEIIRGFNLHINYTFREINGKGSNLARIIFRFDDI